MCRCRRITRARTQKTLPGSPCRNAEPDLGAVHREGRHGPNPDCHGRRFAGNGHGCGYGKVQPFGVWRSHVQRDDDGGGNREVAGTPPVLSPSTARLRLPVLRRSLGQPLAPRRSMDDHRYGSASVSRRVTGAATLAPLRLRALQSHQDSLGCVFCQPSRRMAAPRTLVPGLPVVPSTSAHHGRWHRHPPAHMGSDGRRRHWQLRGQRISEVTRTARRHHAHAITVAGPQHLVGGRSLAEP